MIQNTASSEIISVQLGSYANFVGSHFWNIQDESIGCMQDADWSSVSFTLCSEAVVAWSEDRHGQTTYRPRTVVLDCSGSLGGVNFSRSTDNQHAIATAAAMQSGLWCGGVHVQHTPSIPKSRYRQQLEDAGQLDADLEDQDQIDAQQAALEEAAAELHASHHTPRYWTDFLQVDLADECVLTLPGAWQGQSGWDGWGVSGSSSSTTRELVDAAVDRVRWWAEQCDGLQGLQLFADDLGGWGGISHDVLQHLRDQYPAQPLLYFSLRQQPTHPAAGDGGRPELHPAVVRRNLSSSLSMSEITQLASLYVPLDASSFSAAARLGTSFHAAAVLAAAIDTTTLPLRCTGNSSAAGPAIGGTDLHSMVHLLSGAAANIAAASLQLPAGSLPSSSSSSSSAAAAASQLQQGAQHQVHGNHTGDRDGGRMLDIHTAAAACLTPGVHLTDNNCLAEVFVLRGARCSPAASLCTTQHSQQCLNTLLLQRQQRVASRPCVVHSCLSPMPLPAPLSFPKQLLPAALAPLTSPRQGFTHEVNPAADRSLQLYLPRSSNAAGTPAPGVLSRLTATSGFAPGLLAAASELRQLGRCAASRAHLEEWGFCAADLEEWRENLMGLAGKYSSDDADGL